MKPASPELLALMKTRQFFLADVYTFTLIDGTVLRYCGGDANLTVNGQVFVAGLQTGPYFDRKDNKAKVTWTTGTQAATMTIDCIPKNAMVEGAPMLAAIRAGTFDAADFVMDRLIMPTYGDTRRGFVRMFVGRVAEIDAGRSVATFSINSHLEILDQMFPRNLYQPGCINVLGDFSCGVSPIPSTTGTVQAGATQFVIPVTLVGSFSTGTFDRGTITFTSGALNGVTKGVRSVPFGPPITVNILGELASAPAAGDTFTLFYGCDQSLGPNGCPKFANTARYRGFPFTPQPSAAV